VERAAAERAAEERAAVERAAAAERAASERAAADRVAAERAAAERAAYERAAAEREASAGRAAAASPAGWFAAAPAPPLAGSEQGASYSDDGWRPDWADLDDQQRAPVLPPEIHHPVEYSTGQMPAYSADQQPGDDADR
jgi:hypothetical protein